MSFDPLVEEIRSALRAVDASPRAVAPYLDLIDAYRKCADREREPELLKQAGFVIRDARMLPMEEEQRRRLEELAARVEATRVKIESERQER